jgi:hypothetical protein
MATEAPATARSLIAQATENCSNTTARSASAAEEGLSDFFSGDHCDKPHAARRACQLRAMVDHLGHIVTATTREHTP